MRKYVLGAFLCLLAFNANATIISTDWRITGDNLITQDTDSGLEWLDLTVTDGLSYSTC